MCKKTDTHEPVYQSAFDQVICGREGAYFDKSTRVDKDTLQCAEGKKPCSTATRPENTVCVDKDSDMSDCPVTEIVAFSQNQLSNSKSIPSFSKYTLVSGELQDDVTLAYSKDV